MRPVWAVNVMGGKLFPDDDKPFRSFTLRDTITGAPLLPELIRLAFFELAKRPNDPVLEAWWHFFLTGKARPGDPAYIHEAAGIIERANHNPEETKMATLLEREKWQLQDQLEDARAEGRAEAEQRFTEERAAAEQRIAEGRAEERAAAEQRFAEERAAAERYRAEERRNSMKAALASGIPVQQVANIFEVPAEMVQQLADGE
ncbi:MAG: hypothetical protein FWG25_11190 [Promicromonosporaceae bacterium]|nr:hypothetical protein [Promicromonosporaceae bacterium]